MVNLEGPGSEVDMRRLLSQPLFDLIQKEPGLNAGQLLRRYSKVKSEIKQRHVTDRLTILQGEERITSVGLGRRARWYVRAKKS